MKWSRLQFFGLSAISHRRQKKLRLTPAIPVDVCPNDARVNFENPCFAAQLVKREKKTGTKIGI